MSSLSLLRRRVKAPMKAWEFLAALNKLLDPTHAAADTAAKSKQKQAKAARSAGRSNPLQALSVLGLTCHHLSKKTVALLEVCLCRPAAMVTPFTER